MRKPLGRWYINGDDIVEYYGLYPKRGTFDNLLKGAEMKDYLTEDIREEHGENVSIYKPRLNARDVDLTFYLITDDLSEFWAKLERVKISLGNLGLFELRLASHNRNFQLYYKGMDSNSHKTLDYNGHSVNEIRLSFREPNPRNVVLEDILCTEDGRELTTEQTPNDTFLATLNVYDNISI